MKNKILQRLSLCLCLSIYSINTLPAQSLADANYINSRGVCVGLLYSYDSWKQYWEGTLKRENLNLGSVSIQSIQLMGTYGLTDKLNIVVGMPYVWTKAGEGTLAGQKGLQDIMAGIKYKFFTMEQDKHQLNLSAVIGGSMPVSRYTPDLLPLSIGLHSKTIFGRILTNYRWNQHLTFTAQATYTSRAKVNIDRESYYTTHQIYSDEVAMPDVFSFGLRAGYQSPRWSAELVYERIDCMGGFDIRRNDMPFISNEMDMSYVGMLSLYKIPKWADIQLIAQLRYTLNGKNVGKSTGFSLGIMKAFSLSSSPKVITP
jgi:Putative MetA-pathway of phenol degradation